MHTGTDDSVELNCFVSRYGQGGRPKLSLLLCVLRSMEQGSGQSIVDPSLQTPHLGEQAFYFGRIVCRCCCCCSNLTHPPNIRDPHNTESRVDKYQVPNTNIIKEPFIGPRVCSCQGYSINNVGTFCGLFLCPTYAAPSTHRPPQPRSSLADNLTPTPSPLTSNVSL